jgi:hypothetical protein
VYFGRLLPGAPTARVDRLVDLAVAYFKDPYRYD